MIKQLFILISFNFLLYSIFCIHPLSLLAEDFKTKPKLGIVLPLTGKASAAGEAVRNGINMANQDFGNFFDLVYEDNALEGTLTLNSVNKLIQNDKVNALIVYASGPSNVAAPVAEAASVPMIGMSLDLNVSKNKNWVMIHWASSKNVADKLLDELERRKIKKVAVVTTQSQGILDIENYFLEAAPGRGVEVIYNKQFLPADIDFQTPITILKNKKPEAIFVNLYYGQAGLFANKAAKLGLKTQLFSHFILDDDNEIKSAQGALENAFFANTSNGDLSFEKEYINKFEKRPVIGGIGAYDVVGIFADAISEKVTEVTHLS